MANPRVFSLSSRIVVARELHALSGTLTDPTGRTEARTHRNEQLTEIIKNPRGRALVMFDDELRRMVLESESLSRLLIKRTSDEHLELLRRLPFKGKADRDLRQRLGNGSMTPPRRARFQPAHAS